MSKFKGKRVLVVGFGISGVAAAKYLSKQGAKVMVTDTRQRNELLESIRACEDLKIEYELGKHHEKSFQTSELIVLSPGVPLSLKQLDFAREANVPIVSEIELAAQAIQEPLIAITGTNGKTTTSILMGEMFKADQKPVFVGGNVGKPLLDYVMEGPHGGHVIAELSSFQLELQDKMVPAVAIFTNLEEDHLDRYLTMDAYIAAKKRLLKSCDRNSYVILNHDDPVVSSFAQENPGKLIWFTRKNPIKVGGEFAEKFCGAYYNQPTKQVMVKLTGREESYDLTLFKLYGDHNKENLLAAILGARLMGVSEKAIQQVINTFRGVPHRLEFVRKKDGVFFFNDSKGTNVMSVKRSLCSFPIAHSLILIAGGKDKNMDFTPLQDLVRARVKILILLGEAKEKINRAIGDYTETFLVGTFEEAVLLAFQKSRQTDIILLSPGCSSFDMFRNYEERGDYFKKLVSQL